MQRTRRKWPMTSLIMMLAMSLACSTAALAGGKHDSGYDKSHHAGHSKKGYGMRHHLPFSPLAMKEELGLSEEQVKALEPMETEYRKTLIKTNADFRIAIIDLASLLDQQNPDRDAIAAKIDEIVALKKRLMLYRVDTLLKLKEILTPAQYERFRARLKHHMEHGMGSHMHGGTMGHGMMSGSKKSGHGEGMMGGYGREEDDDE